MTACFRIPGQSPVPDHCEAREVEKGFWCKPGRQLLWGRLKEGNSLLGENACMRSYEDELTIPTRSGDDQPSLRAGLFQYRQTSGYSYNSDKPWEDHGIYNAHTQIKQGKTPNPEGAGFLFFHLS